MPTYFQRPENALKRANEFIDVGKKQRALDVLYDVIKSKKHRTWQKIHEPIMELYLQLCVELRKSHIAKEGLYQYKNICQQVNIKSLEDVVRQYIALAEKKTEEARQESHQTVIDIDDLDNPDTPESLLLKAVSGEDTQDRTDRAILTPWVKFLWESYRQCLDLLRNNSRVERLYQDIAQQAFKFCLKYGRKTEFRKLCDNLRTHLGHIHKHQHQQTAINLNNPESQAMHLETRLEQLDSAIKMELWQEAFKAVEDIHGLIQLSKKPPKPSLMANYYQKLGLVFWKSGNALFHASTLHRLYQLSREQRKNLSTEELQKMASRVLCATLAVPIPPSRNLIDQLLETDETTMDKTKRLATLLMLNVPPTRLSLIKDVVKYSVVQYVHPELQNLYKYLEVEFHPLDLYSKVQSSINFITDNSDLSQYIPVLEDIIITRVLKQVSQVYQTIAFDRIVALVPFASKFRLERVIVNAARTLELQVRIDHRSESLSFGTDLMVAQKEDVPEGPYIQSMPSETIRNQLISMAKALHKAINIIQPKERKTQRDELRVQVANNYKLTSKKDHLRILQRRQIIEDRKEQLEHLNDQREKEELEQVEEQKKKAYEAEMARLDREAKERERQRKMEEHKEIQKKHAMERIEQLKKTDIGAKVLQNLDEEDFASLDVEDIMAKQVEQLEKEKKELMDRLKNQEKKIDYFARAKRLEEIPSLVKQYEEERKKAKDFWEEEEAQRIELLKKERLLALESQDRLARMRKDKDDFMSLLRGQRKEQFKRKLSEFESKLTEERKKRLQERKEKRKEERRNKWIEEKAEAEQRAKDEALKREREEKERIEREKLEEEKREYEARLAKLEEQANKQRQREKEIEEREAKRKEEMVQDRMRDDRGRGRDMPPADRPSSWRDRVNETEGGGGGGGTEGAWRPSREGGWREREKQRQDRWKKEPSPTKRPDEEWGGRRDEPSAPPPAREDDGWRSRAPPSRDGGGWRERTSREEHHGDERDSSDRWKSRAPPSSEREYGDRGPPPREDRRDDRESAWRDRGPPRDDRDGWRDRGAPRDDRDGWRSRGGPRDDRRDDRRDERRGGDTWRDRRGPPGRDDRDRSQRDDNDDRGAWRGGGGRSGGRDEPWSNRGGDRERDGWRSREDRGPPRDDRRGGDRDDRRGGDRDDRRGGDREDRRGGDREDTWRRGGSDSQMPSREGGRGWRDKQEKPKRSGEEEDDGWTTVRYT